MKQASTNALYPNDIVTKSVIEYSASHSTPLPKTVTDLHADTVANHARSEYLTSNNQSQCHAFIAKLMGAKRVLEIGTFVGYSALVWSHAVGPEGKVTTLEFSEEYAAAARDNLAKAGANNVEVVLGNALETLKTLAPTEPYDLIFIDAQKSGYPGYLETILARSAPDATARLLRAGGVIVADNVLRRALVADESEHNPWSAAALALDSTKAKSKSRSEYETDRDLESLRQYNDNVIGNARLDAFLMPLYDGVSFARLLD